MGNFGQWKKLIEMANLSKKNSKQVENTEKKITGYFTQKKILKEESVQSQSNENQHDIFTQALKKQSESQNEPTDPISSKASETNVPSYEQLHDLVVKLKAMLNDEKKAKVKLLDDYKLLEQKYVSNLQLMVKTQSLLLKHKTYVKDTTSAQRNETISIEPENDSSNQQKSDDVEELLVLEAGQDFEGGVKNSQVKVIANIPHEDMVKLNSIPPAKTHDATFVRSLLDILYVDKNKIQYRTVSGRSRSVGVTKQPVTPEKVNLITELFMKRIKNCGANNEEKILRMNGTNINRLIAYAIDNLKKK